MAATPQAAVDTPLSGAAVSVLGDDPGRHGWLLANTGASGTTGYCTDDGSMPTLSHWTIAVYGQGTASNPPGIPVSPAPLLCLGSGSITAEQW